MCGFCNIGKEVDPPSPIGEDDFNKVTNGVWIGEFTVDNLPVPLYRKTAMYLMQGIDLGVAEFEKVDELLIKDLTDNIYQFSGAKTYQQVRHMTAMMADKELKSNFYKFKEAVKPMFHDYNEAYLQAEYQTAKASARSAADWKRIEAEADVLPLLKYQTVGDGRVRPTHRELDNIVRPYNDKFWTNYYPPNGWRCRCTVIQLADGEEEITNLQGWLKPNDVPEEFMMNAGIDGYVFKYEGKGRHPYFKVAKGDKKLKENNFNLPLR